jgi:hypothetical protein
MIGVSSTIIINLSFHFQHHNTLLIELRRNYYPHPPPPKENNKSQKNPSKTKYKQTK